MFLTQQKNVIDVPVVCPIGQKPDKNGKCREEWDARNVVEDVSQINLSRIF